MNAPGSKNWNFYVHNDGRYVSINDGLRGDTLLKVTDHPDEAYGDVEKVRSFAEDYKQRLPLQVIKERLTSNEAIDAAFARVTSYPPDRRSDQYRYTREMFEAALDAAFSKEEAGDD